MVASSFSYKQNLYNHTAVLLVMLRIREYTQQAVGNIIITGQNV